MCCLWRVMGVRTRIRARAIWQGTFEFTLVADGVYIEHKWGPNSGHVGVPLARADLIQRV